MKAKTLLITLIVAALTVLGSLSALLTPTLVTWLGVITYAVTLILQIPGIASGTLPTEWSWVMWLTNIGAIILQIVNNLGEHNLLPPQDIIYITIAINTFIQVVVKNYGAGSLLFPKK